MVCKKTPEFIMYEKPFENTEQNLIRIDHKPTKIK